MSLCQGLGLGLVTAFHKVSGSSPWGLAERVAKDSYHTVELAPSSFGPRPHEVRAIPFCVVGATCDIF